MNIDDFLKLPGLSGERGECEKQIRAWLSDIQTIGHFEHLTRIAMACQDLWTRQQHDHYTTHGLEHSGRIVAKLADWLQANRTDALKPMEAFLLIGAAYLHDVGMQCRCPSFLQAEKIPCADEQYVAPDYVLLERIRERHPFLSERMITDACKALKEREWPEFQLNAQSFFHEAHLMAEISRCHCEPISAIKEKHSDTDLSYTVAQPVRLMLLIHLLRIGDALDADTRRLNRVFLDQHRFEKIPVQGQFHFLKHACTASVERHGIGHFVFHYTFPADTGDIKPAVQQAAERYLREHVRDAGRLLSENRIALIAVESVTEDENTTCPYKFTPAAREKFRAYAVDNIGSNPRQDPTAYLNWLHAKTSHIEIRGLVVGSGKAQVIPIEDLYIPLTTSMGGERGLKAGANSECAGAEVAAHPDLKNALSERTLVIVGDPGAGKSTFLKRITAALCDAWLGRDPKAAETRLGLKDRPLPVLIDIHALAMHIEKNQNRNQGPTSGPRTPAWLAHFLAESGKNENWGLDETYFRNHFENGAALVMLDGLDEAPSRVIREQLSELARNAALAYKGCRFVVTSRPAAYVEKVVLPGFAQAWIEDLSDPAIEKFLGLWSKALHHDNPIEAESYRVKLVEAWHCRPEIRKLARNPVMLTALAVVHWHEKRIPEQRVDLYESIMTWLARAREQKPGRLPDILTLERLAEVALAMQDAEGGRLVQTPRLWAAERIAHHWPELPADKRAPAAEKFLAEEEVDSGIVVGREHELRFWHLTFQEYLAACALAALDGEERKYRLLGQPAKLYAPEWRETVLMFAAELRKRRGEKIAQGMVSSILDGLGLGQNATLAERARCVGLLGAIIRDLSAFRFVCQDKRYGDLMEQVMAIFDREKSQTVPIQDAIAAAEALGQAGDPRFENAARAENWVKIGVCEFRMGESQRVVKLDAYSIGRYPVTVLEYKEFVENGGYADAQWWQAGGHGQWLEPDEWQDQLEHPTRPLVNVSWFEACAYARWKGCRLPTEAEWERAAAGMEGRKYPWGDTDPNDRLANYNIHVNSPTPVGVYPGGVTPDGIADMAGNVWEWCKDWYDLRQKYRVLRGGSWLTYGPDSLLSSDRDGNVPDFRYDYSGFRVVRSSSPKA